MKLIETLKKRVRDLMDRTGANTGMAKEFKDIFQIGGVPAFNQFYYFGIFIWKYLYKGYYKAWHNIADPTIQDQNHRRDLERMDAAKAISAEMAGLIWSEQCKVGVSQGDGEEQPLNDFIHFVLEDNNFNQKMQEFVEQILALGGGAMKAWYEVKHDKNSNEIPGSGRIKIGFCMADQFIPIAWTNSQVTDGVFISRQAKGGYYYTRLEWHKWDGETYWISNELFRADAKKEGAQEGQDILGFRYPLDTIYPFLNESTPLQGLEHSLFAYIRTAIANNLDDNSPLGVSIYANALSTLHALDICYDSFIREFVLGKKRIIVPSQAIRTVIDPKTGMAQRYFDANDSVYQAMYADDISNLKIQDNSVELRVEEHVAAINAFLSILCLQVGFSAGTFTFDKATGLKTATEVISENSKTYKTIKSNQLQLKGGIEKIVNAIVEVAALYDVQYEGHSIRKLAEKGWKTKVTFDDSILQDRQTNINEGVTLCGNGLLSKKKFMMDTLGYTEDEAEAEIQQIAKEGAIPGTAIDFLNLGGSE